MQAKKTQASKPATAKSGVKSKPVAKSAAPAAKKAVKAPAAPAKAVKSPAAPAKAVAVKKAPATKSAAPAAKKVVKAPAAPVKAVKSPVAPAKPAVSKASKAKPAPKKASGSVDVVFERYSPQSQSVDLVGTFNDWTLGKHPLRRDESGRWSTVVKLKPGSYEYKFVYDGLHYEPDPDRELVANSFGSANNLLIVA
ncbi:MAG TPA: glycogen-binding domain-containing protein [Fibrobacteria bacterium]|nr:glycogen-binding domain-containing protein [Fibrobacteria bacterium]HOX51567.1 glycogen-binding domain-containing protein [Fibrobacteria bacterium]